MTPKTPTNTPTTNGAPARPASLLKMLREHRRARDEDERVRLSLGLRYIGLIYGPFNAEPQELFADSSGNKIIKIKLGFYRRIDK